VDNTRNLLRFGSPLMFAVLVLVIALGRVGAGDPEGLINDDPPAPGDERQVQQVQIESVDVQLAESFPVQVFVEISGYLPDPCWEPQVPVVQQDGDRFEIEIMAERDPDEVCPQVIEDYSETVALGSMDPGAYVVIVNGVEQSFEVH
jgi:hypothetical protein